jgi:hypothetical protein
MAEEEAGVGTGATATERQGPGVRRFEDERGHERKGAGGWQRRDGIASGEAWTSAVVEHTGEHGRRRRGTESGGGHRLKIKLLWFFSEPMRMWED